VNLIGEHTDYNLGLVLPMAIDLACFVSTAPSGDGWLRVHSKQLGRSAQWRVEELRNRLRQGDWSDRVVGIARELARREIPVAGQNVLIDSRVPVGGGLSSSAALGVALALALGGPREPRALAQLAWAAETDFVGVPCGIMDQFVSASGQAGAAILLDCRTLEWRAVKLPEDVAVVVANSMIKRELGQSAYRTRVEECNQAARALRVPSLRDASSGGLDTLDEVLRKRARHVITENERVEAFGEAAERGDIEEMGRLLIESHQSLRDDYEVSCPELDFLVDTAIAVPRVLGARMMGGGFGGSTVNLVFRDAVEALQSALIAAYQEFRGCAPEIHVCVASRGACEVTLPL
jgi:galactokinase